MHRNLSLLAVSLLFVAAKQFSFKGTREVHIAVLYQGATVWMVVP